jgi:methyltransferase family protein
MSVDAPAPHRLSSRVRLTAHELHRFQGPTLFDHIARVVCAASCLPRKELYESWEVARRARRRFRGGRIVDLACGHGLVAHMMLLLDDTSEGAIAVDRRVPKSAGILAAAMVREWPRLAGRIEIAEREVAAVEVRSGDVVVSAHACGGLTDEVLDLAIGASARVVVLPCCQAEGKGDLGGVGGWMDGALAIDVTRAARLRAHGYAVYTQTIPAEITAKNRLLLGAPPRERTFSVDNTVGER